MIPTMRTTGTTVAAADESPPSLEVLFKTVVSLVDVVDAAIVAVSVATANVVVLVVEHVGSLAHNIRFSFSAPSLQSPSE